MREDAGEDVDATEADEEEEEDDAVDADADDEVSDDSSAIQVYSVYRGGRPSNTATSRCKHAANAHSSECMYMIRACASACSRRK